MAFGDFISPLIATGLGIWGAHEQSKLYGDYASQQDQLAKQQASMAQSMLNLGQGQISMGMPALSKAMQHYMTLATGNRAAIGQEIAPERAELTDTFSGAQRGMEAKMAPGPVRDQAIAQLAQQRAGRLGLLPMEARRNAFGQLATMGGQAVDRGERAYGEARQDYGQEAESQGRALKARLGGAEAWNQFGQNMGTIWGPALGGLFKRGGGMTGGSSSAGTTPWEPGGPMWG